MKTATSAATTAAIEDEIRNHFKPVTPARGLTNNELEADSSLLPLHRLGFAEAIRPAPDLGIPGELVWLPVEALRIDPRYQRPILAAGRRTIRAIIEGFSWAKFSPIVVGARAGGLYAIIDGQHRATAALTHGGITHVPCLVIHGGAAVEASAFAIINGQVTGITSTQIHIARVMGGEPDALEIDRVCKAAGVRISRNLVVATMLKPGDTLAIGTIRSCLKRYGDKTLICALRCVTKTDDGNPGYLRAPIIQGLCEALSGHPGWRVNGAALFAAISSAGIPGMYRAARAFREQKGGTEWVAFAKVTTELLNRTMPKLGALTRGNP